MEKSRKKVKVIEIKKRATIQDVADLAKVSITTVSRVINDNYPVSIKTKAKVNKAIQELGFRPNLLARSLTQDTTQTIGILVPSIENLFFSEVIKGIDTYTNSKKYRTFLCNTEGKKEKEKEMVDALLSRNVDGIIVIDPRTKNIKTGYYEEISSKLPLVLVNGYNDGMDCNYVLNDELIGTTKALEYFIEQKKREIYFIRGKKSHSYDIKERIFREFMTQHQLPCEEKNIITVEGGNGSEVVWQVKEAIKKRIHQKTQIEGILCCNDLMAIGALHGVLAENKKVPEDISIIGFDNTVVSQITDPPLSTVDHNMKQLGETAARRIFELMEHKGADSSKISVGTKLVVRGT